MYTINNVNIFSNSIEGQALSQMFAAMNNSWVVKGALMADSHCGYSLPIGGVAVTKDVIVPSWVGYDIGCGVGAINTFLKLEEIHDFKQDIYNMIVSTIPLGVGIYRDKAVMSVRQIHDNFRLECSDFMMTLLDQRAMQNLGSLGSGNHFLEIGVDSNSYVWIIVHSGSRGVGHACATHYMNIAQPLTGSKEGSYPLEVDSVEGKNYVKDLAFMLEFALANRAILLNDVLNCIHKVIYKEKERPYVYRTGSPVNMRSCDIDERVSLFINRNHNHAEYKDGVWIHRKGATHADKDMYGVIPGNMRDGSFIVKGKGSEDSICSSSHGAGRVLGRKQAKRELDPLEFIETMKNVVCGVNKDPGCLLDEAPAAYKDIFTVMDEQKDLVDVVHHIRPLINVKR